MNTVEGLAYGFSVGLAPVNLVAVLAGVLIGTLVGVLPGIGPVGAIALLLPMVTTLKLHPATGLIVLAGIVYGAQYGGSTTSILINVPGEATSVATCFEGYPMAKKGRGGAALAVSAFGSFIAGTLGIVGLMFFAPLLAKFALSFGPPEFFAFALFALFTLSRISGGSIWRALFVLSIGLALSTIGLDPIVGLPRYNFGFYELTQGIALVPVVMGLYGIAEVLSMVEEGAFVPKIPLVKFRELFPKRLEWLRSIGPVLRGSVLGFFFGLVPGPSPILSTFASYRLERRLSKYPAEWGDGAIEGVAGPEAANNGAVAGSMIPLLSLGIPFTPGTAMLLAGLMIQGVKPGPLLIAEHPDIFWGVISSMYIGNVALLILNYPLAGVWVQTLRMPRSVLVASIVLLCLVGAYQINNSLLDLVVMCVMGLVGYILKKLEFDVAPMVIALILGPVLETSLRQSFIMSGGDPLIFFERPISVLFIGALFLVLALPFIWRLMSRRREPTRIGQP